MKMEWKKYTDMMPKNYEWGMVAFQGMGGMCTGFGYYDSPIHAWHIVDWGWEKEEDMLDLDDTSAWIPMPARYVPGEEGEWIPVEEYPAHCNDNGTLIYIDYLDGCDDPCLLRICPGIYDPDADRFATGAIGREWRLFDASFMSDRMIVTAYIPLPDTFYEDIPSD